MASFVFFISVIVCSYYIFDIQIIGTMPQVNQQMKKDLKKEKVDLFQPLKSYERLNEILNIAVIIVVVIIIAIITKIFLILFVFNIRYDRE